MVNLKKLLVVIALLILPVITLAQMLPMPFEPGGEGGGQTGGNPGGQTGCNPATTNCLPNPLGNDIDSLTEFVYAVLNDIVLPIGAVIVVFFIIYSGFLFVTARGNESKLEKAKETLLWVIIGSVILLGSWVIAAAIAGTLCQVANILCDAPGQNGIRN